MRKSEIEIGSRYVARVSGTLQILKIRGENPAGGWDAVNERTGRTVRIKSSQRLSRKWELSEDGL